MPISFILGGFILGIVIGSFLANIAVRWPAGGSAVHGRSMCRTCGHVLTGRDLVPVFSWLWRQGRCHHCRAPISPLYPLVEVCAGAIGLAAFAVFPGQTLPALAAATLGWLLLLAAVLDIAHFWLPDRLNLTILCSGLAWNTLGPWPALGWQTALIGAVSGYVSLAAVAFGYRHWRGREGLGQGDPKLLGAIGAWTGWQLLAWTVFGAALAGLAVAVVMAMRGGAVSGGTRLPLGALLAVAAWPIWLIANAVMFP